MYRTVQDSADVDTSYALQCTLHFTQCGTHRESEEKTEAVVLLRPVPPPSWDRVSIMLYGLLGVRSRRSCNGNAITGWNVFGSITCKPTAPESGPRSAYAIIPGLSKGSAAPKHRRNDTAPRAARKCTPVVTPLFPEHVLQLRQGRLSRS
jgi:hypothetical protein